ncbi:hypothetical protein EVB78_006 [Rhizobium phage RHph_N1_15]|nr:hypothetical protein EVB77_006 [Rhizobium phage RHph_N1_10]QIG69208.1 hypothetical protein EVB78_006 [Rhizobium phage RHph_N1_15]QIG75068.1 hypothetical protein EVC15_006 [Rhizobium phage RHph_N2_6]
MTIETVNEDLRQVALEHREIRFLPTKRDHGTYWIKAPERNQVEDTANLMLSLAQEHGAPVYKQIKRRTYHNALPAIGTTYDQPRPSKHRSKRLWKKLRRKTARPLYGEPMVLSFNPEVIRRLMMDA